MSRTWWDDGADRDLPLAVALGERPADLAIRGGRLVDVHTGEIYAADVAIAGGRIAAVGDVERCVGEQTRIVEADGRHLVPGLIDTHFHIGSSALAMTEMARLLVPFGTAALVTDFYEPSITNGVDAMRFLLDESARTPLRVYLSPFCPAYGDPANLSVVTPEDFEQVMDWPECAEVREWYVEREHRGDGSERRIGAGARRRGLRLSGHLAAVHGPQLQAAAAAGIRSDHEVATAQEALERARLGIAVQMRWSSGSRDVMQEILRALVEHRCDSRMFMFSTDEEDVDDFADLGHVDHRVRMAIELGVPAVDAIRMGSLNAAVHLGATADLGSVAPGRLAFVNLVDDLARFHISTVVAGGQVVGEQGRWVAEPFPALDYPPDFHGTIRIGRELAPADFRIPVEGAPAQVTARVIGALGDERWEERHLELPAAGGELRADPERDLAKVAVVERHRASGKLGVGLLQGFGLRAGAFASSFYPVGMNVGVVGVDDADMALAVNRIAALDGGFVAVRDGRVLAEVPMPLLGYLSSAPAEEVADGFRTVRRAIAELGCRIPGLYTVLGYLLLPVSPGLHIGIDGLVRVAYGEEEARTPLEVVVA